MAELGLTEFCEEVEKLVKEWFSDKEKDGLQKDYKMEEVIFRSGVYGTNEQAVRNRINELMTNERNSSLKMAKLKYAFSQVFLNYKNMSVGYPILKKYPFLLPGCWIFRIFKVLFTMRDKLKGDWNFLKGIKK